MPQLVKGGKFVFGWSVVGPAGEIVIPPDAFEEYGFQESETMVLFSASRTSGGFILARRTKLAASPMAPALTDLGEQAVGRIGRRTFATCLMGAGMIRVATGLLAAFGAPPGNRLLAVRGSHMGLGMIVKGRIVREAERHPEIPVFNTAGAW